MCLVLNKIFRKTKGSFSSSALWKEERKKWVSYIENKGWLNIFLLRLTKMNAEKQNEAFCEISSIFFLETKCGFLVKKLEPPGLNGTVGDFILNVDSTDIFCEVKSPGWEADIFREQGPHSPRLRLPKYINAEARASDNSPEIRYAVNKAYKKIPDGFPSLLIINDDLWLSIFDEVPVDGMPTCIYRALYYEPSQPPYTDLRPQGCFVSDEYKKLSGVLFIRTINRFPENKIIYQDILSINRNALHQLPQVLTDKL